MGSLSTFATSGQEVGQGRSNMGGVGPDVQGLWWVALNVGWWGLASKGNTWSTFLWPLQQPRQPCQWDSDAAGGDDEAKEEIAPASTGTLRGCSKDSGSERGYPVVCDGGRTEREGRGGEVPG